MAAYDVDIGNFNDLFSLEGKVAVVTGGSRGLGLSGASGLMQAGCSKVYITSRKAAACDEACKLLNALPNKRRGATAIPIPCELNKVSEIERLVKEVEKTTDHVDILFANAGATWGAPFLEHSEKNWDRVMDLNVKSVYFCAQKFTPLLSARASVPTPSRIIVTSSVAGLSVNSDPTASVPAYHASKAAALHLVRHMSVELGPTRHILANAICPGFFPSRMANGVIEKGGGLEKMSQNTPTRRTGVPGDIAGTLVWLCSRAGGHVSGEFVELDGGKMWFRSRM